MAPYTRGVLLPVVLMALGALGCGLSSDDDSEAAASAVGAADAFRTAIVEFDGETRPANIVIDERGGAYVQTLDRTNQRRMRLVTGSGTRPLPALDGVTAFSIDDKALYFAKGSDTVLYATDLDGTNVRTLGDPRPLASSKVVGDRREFTDDDVSSYSDLVADPKGIFVVESVIDARRSLRPARLLLLEQGTWSPREIARFDIEGDIAKVFRLDGATFLASRAAPARVIRVGDDGKVTTPVDAARGSMLTVTAGTDRLFAFESPATLHEITPDGGVRRQSANLAGPAIQWSAQGLVTFGSRNAFDLSYRALRMGRVLGEGLQDCWTALRIVRASDREQLYCTGQVKGGTQKVLVRYDLTP